jgi:two-component system CheB/CheR fusion protein
MNAGETSRNAASPSVAISPSRQIALAELCGRATLATHAPATVLVTRKCEYLYSLGPTARYLRVASGHATTDVLAMVGEDLRTRLRTAILRAIQDNALVVVSGGRTEQGGVSRAFAIEVSPVSHDGEELLLIHFVDQPQQESHGTVASADSPRVAELERELAATREELQGAIRSLELSSDEQRAINENALSANEEFQSTNEELLTSKEELQSLNEELTALNSQLQETLEQQRMSANDLQNVLFSTDVATLFLDAELKIRFFTPATKALFNVIKTDVGRPLTDLHSLAADEALASDARRVLETSEPAEVEVETASGAWCRRILPYRTHDGAVEGVVITFTDITGRKNIAQALEAARREADLANAAKSQFLAAASHDLRQPLQTLALLQGLLASRVVGTSAADLVSRLADTVSTMSDMLNTLLDINQIEAGVIKPEKVDFRIGDVLGNLAAAFDYQAQAKGLELRVVSSGLTVYSDPHLLEQILCNLISNAVKYTRKGKVLVGCRRVADILHIEVLDTGIGVPDRELKSIFEEFRQLDNVARERSRGLGLGLSIVRRLASLLGHPISVRSLQGRGSVFSISVPVSGPAVTPMYSLASDTPGLVGRPDSIGGHAGSILVVEDEPEVRSLLSLVLSEEGFVPVTVADGPKAIGMIDAGGAVPDLLLTDYNLPNGMDGLEVAANVRARLGAAFPVIILTGDISTEALSAIAGQGCIQLNKPVNSRELTLAVMKLLPVSAHRPESRPIAPEPKPVGRMTVFVVDDDDRIRDTVRLLLEDDGRTVHDYASCEAFLEAYSPSADGCLLVDAYLPGMCGLDLLKHLRASGDPIPTIMITGHSDVGMAVQAMKAGASNFIEKPIAGADLLASIDRAMERAADKRKQRAWQLSAAEHMAGLTPRQHEIMAMVLAGHPSKNIAADLKISQRTVENHRSAIMRKTGAASLPALTRLALAASEDAPEPLGVKQKLPNETPTLTDG